MTSESTPERRNLEEMRRFQTLGTSATRRKSAPYLQNIDKVLEDYEDSDSARELAKAKNTARIEKIFPGVEEDEKTISGMYEPSTRHFSSNQTVYYQQREDVSAIEEERNIYHGYLDPSDITSHDQQLRMFPSSIHHSTTGTGSSRYQPQPLPSDSDSDTPDFGTERDDRDYAGFVSHSPYSRGYSDNDIGSEAYWENLDSYSRTAQQRIRTERDNREREAQQRREATRAYWGNPTRVNRRRRDPEAGPVRNVRSAAELMAQGNPARAGGTRATGSHSFRARQEPAYHTGRLPRALSPNLRNLETDFTVYSYDTPIAWRTTSNHWEVPNIYYSKTTQKHQSAIRNALRQTYHSPFDEARQRIYNLREQHRQQRIDLPSTNYNLSIGGFETFSPEPASEETVNAIVQNHIEHTINPAIARWERRRRNQRQQQNPNQPQLPL